MNRSRVTILALSFLLLASNVLWAYHSVDAAVTAGYRDMSFREYHEALAQALALLPVAALPEATSAQVVEAAKKSAGTTDSYEKDGFVWVGLLGLRFGKTGRLVEARPSWSSP